MKLSDLIKDFPTSVITHDHDISSISSNSKDVKPGGLFIAVKGFVVDGHDYIDQAFENGAIAVIAQTNHHNRKNVILVDNSRLAMAFISANFYGHPSNEMTVVGITGTNGKTTTTWLLESIFETCGFATGVIGTINIRYNHQVFDNPVTTPDAIDLQKTLYRMNKAGVTHVIMEVSSHGLDLNRVDYCQFDLGVFTNLSQDHLDYHKGMEDYFNCKKRFFTQCLRSGKNKNPVAILNIDDSRGETLLNSLTYKTIGVSTKKQTDIFSNHINDDIHGLSGTFHLGHTSFDLKSQLTGTFNLENILCAAGAAHALNIPSHQIKKGIERCHTIPGRLEKIKNTIDRFLFVDYAHTPDALESILTTLKQRAPKRIITVFGCGGDRDRSKRPLMGQVACKNSHIAIVSSDNPRSENPDSIINDILKGLNEFSRLSDDDLLLNPFKKGYLVECDRKKALKKAVFISKPGDIIVAAGKGHETYQVTNSGIIHFDDKEELTTSAIAFANQFKPIAWEIKDLSKALGTNPVLSTIQKDYRFAGISTDSRAILDNQIFIAIKGENFDGHRFINTLVEKGIKGFITEKGFLETLDKDTKQVWFKNNLIFFETPNTLTALGQLASYQRIRSKVKVLAITGSSGKTTTRRILEEIFKNRFHTHATLGNFNNEIGLPLTLLALSKAHEWAIVEMGMNHPGEISRLSQIAHPDIAMVINTAGAHLEGLGSLENVAKAKAEIFDGIRENGTGILFAGDPRRHILETKARTNEHLKTLLFFGSGQGSKIKSDKIQGDTDSTSFKVKSDNEEVSFCVNSPALFMVDNCLAAICAARAADICWTSIKKGIRTFRPEKGRMGIYRLNAFIHIIDDTYNANPASVTQALNTLSSVSKGKNSIAVLGDMLELGEKASFLHKQIGKDAALLGINKLYLFGSLVKHTIKGAIENGFSTENIFHGIKEQIAQHILENLDSETWILVKGSRGMSMETVVNEFHQNLSTDAQGGYDGTFKNG